MVHRCKWCEAGFPDVEKNKCIPFESEPEAKNCLWGGVFDHNKKIKCVRCAKGYAVMKGKCVVTPVKGCWEIHPVGKECLICDGYNDYSMIKDGECKKFVSPIMGV